MTDEEFKETYYLLSLLREIRSRISTNEHLKKIKEREHAPKKMFFEAYKGCVTEDGIPAVATLIVPRFGLIFSPANEKGTYGEIITKYAYVKKIEMILPQLELLAINKCFSILEINYKYRKGRFCFATDKSRGSRGKQICYPCGIYCYASSKERAIEYAIWHTRKEE